jgi:hypothetical protein
VVSGLLEELPQLLLRHPLVDARSEVIQAPVVDDSIVLVGFQQSRRGGSLKVSTKGRRTQSG